MSENTYRIPSEVAAAYVAEYARQLKAERDAALMAVAWLIDWRGHTLDGKPVHPEHFTEWQDRGEEHAAVIEAARKLGGE